MRDYLFLPGLALMAARRTLREGEPLYVPRDWTVAEPDRGTEDDAGRQL